MSAALQRAVETAVAERDRAEQALIRAESALSAALARRDAAGLAERDGSD